MGWSGPAASTRSSSPTGASSSVTPTQKALPTFDNLARSAEGQASCPTEEGGYGGNGAPGELVRSPQAFPGSVRHRQNRWRRRLEGARCNSAPLATRCRWRLVQLTHGLCLTTRGV